VPVKALSSIAFLSGAYARGTVNCGATRLALGAVGFGAGRFGAAFLDLALGAEAAFFGVGFFPAVRFAATVFFTAGLRAFGFALFFAAIEPPPFNAYAIVRELARLAKHGDNRM
jgi:hypothetical protein